MHAFGRILRGFRTVAWALLLIGPALPASGQDSHVYPPETESARTAGRIGFLPHLSPPWTDFVVEAARLSDGSSVGFGAGAAFNRVDGFSFLGSEELSNQGWLPSLRLYEGYGFSSKRWSGGAEVSIRPSDGPFVLGARWFEETAPWPLPVQALHPEEQFAAMALLRRDYADYLRRRGGSGFLEWRPGAGRGLVLSWSEERHESLDRAVARPGPFGGARVLPANPQVEEGCWHLGRLRGSWSFGASSEAREIPEVHAFLAEVVASGSPFGGGPEFVRVWAEQRGRQRLTSSQFLGYRGAVGWAPDGDGWLVPGRRFESRLPVQWRFQAGGLQGLRGHRYQEFEGDRLLLGTLEYGLLFANEQVRPIVFLDGGKAWYEEGDATGGIEGSGELALDGGVGLQLGSSESALRIDVARDLRAARAPVRVSLRLGFPY